MPALYELPWEDQIMDMQGISNHFRRTVCPLCASLKLIQIGDIVYESPILFSSTIVKLGGIPELWKCSECGSAFVQNVLQEDTARDLYSQGDSTSRWSTMAFEQQKPPEIVVELSRLFTDGKEHLDIGCSAGSLLDFARERGCLTTGVDYSSITRDFIERKGHAWFPSFEALEERTFDIITAFDLIEHLYDVPLFLQECGRRLRPGGRLVILTGNIDSLSAKVSREHWWYVAYPEHIVFPSVQFFRAYSRYRLERLIPTYAAKAYQAPLGGRIAGVVSNMLRGCYRGLPSLGPDHMLLTLCA